MQLAKHLFVAALLLLGLNACQGEPGEPGPAGPDGVDGPGGPAGEDGNGMGDPSDTYFSLAVTDNGNNHAGERLLFLDFADKDGAFDVAAEDRGNVVVGGMLLPPSSITLDGDLDDWRALDAYSATTVMGAPQNNYPLSNYVDAVDTEIEVSVGYDDTWVMMALRWEDAGHDASDDRAMWVFGDQGNGESGWNAKVQRTPGAMTPAAAAPNAVGPLFEAEGEDQVFVMWPIADAEGMFAEGSLGCAQYCHANLGESGDPDLVRVGEGVANMHATNEGEMADVWRWGAATTDPVGFAGDGSFVFQDIDAFTSGWQDDVGRGPTVVNELDGSNSPMFQHYSGLSTVDTLVQKEAVLLAGTPTDGDFVPGNLLRLPSGSAADVQAASSFDGTHWTLELKRLRNTGSGDDMQFVERDEAAQAPTDVERAFGDPAAGELAFDTTNCDNCHGPFATGIYDSGLGIWVFPRVHRAGTGLIFSAIHRVSEMNGFDGISEQDVADIAAWLQSFGDTP